MKKYIIITDRKEDLMIKKMCKNYSYEEFKKCLLWAGFTKKEIKEFWFKYHEDK